jgi:hypothetical protein
MIPARGKNAPIIVLPQHGDRPRIWGPQRDGMANGLRTSIDHRRKAEGGVKLGNETGLDPYAESTTVRLKLV